jgi:hypothetical protein
MNPNTHEPGFELPTPQPQGGSESVPDGTEKLSPARPEVSNQLSDPVTSQATTSPVALPTDDQTSPTIQPSTQSHAAAPSIADDNDLIEKEWVQKAKQIVAATKDDPYTQNKEISRFKADYLKKRYNKDVKLEDS